MKKVLFIPGQVLRVDALTWMLVLFLVGILIWPQAAFGFEVKHFKPHPGSIAINKRKGPMAKADTALFKAFEEYQAHKRQGLKIPFKPSNPLVQFSRGKILIDAVASNDGKALLDDLKGLGLQKGSRFGSVVSGWFPLGAVKKAVALGSLRFISASLRPQTHVGEVTSEGDAAMKADIARNHYPVDGSGVTVGVLSDSYNQQNGAEADVRSGDLPSEVTVLDDMANCGEPCSDEGRAMMQIIHDVAPEANLAFHTAFKGMADFANGIIELEEVAGANVIVDDVIYYAEPMFEDGIIAQAVDQVVESGVAYFSSAGNANRNSYESPYEPSGEHLWVQTFFGLEDRGELHDFDSGESVDWLQRITVPVGGIAIFTLQWDSPFGSLHQGDGSSNDLDIYLVDENAEFILAESISDNILGGEPVEVLQFVNYGLFGTEFNIMIAHFAGPHAGLMKYVRYNSGGVTVNEYTTGSGTLYGHANAAGAEAVGAAYYKKTPEFGVDPPELEGFSSAGGTPILFDTSGRLADPEIREKPEIVAPDGVNTTFFYADTEDDVDEWPNFFGTSAAAPHAAAVAALMLDGNSSMTPSGIYSVMENTALDMVTAGFDFDSGYGFVQADQAVQEVTANNPPIADFKGLPISGYAPLSVQFTDLSAGIIDTWSWDFGDGGSSTDQNPSHKYLDPGTYTVSLTVMEPGGSNTETKTDYITVNPTQAYVGVNDMVTGRYETSGKGKNKALSFKSTNRFKAGENVVIRAHVVDSDGNHVIGATVNIDITGFENVSLTTGPSDDDGMAEATWNTHAKKGRHKGTTPGDYSATTMGVTANGFTWDGTQTSTNFTIY